MTKSAGKLPHRSKLPYRPCVGLALFNAKGQVFVGQRIDQNVESWQMPQGGIDRGETPRVAAMRELEEEIGTDKAEIIEAAPGWFAYDLPRELQGRMWGGKYRGQKQKWFALRFTGHDRDINLATKHPEFKTWRWVEFDQVSKLIVPFKRPIYRQITKALGHVPGMLRSETGKAAKSKAKSKKTKATDIKAVKTKKPIRKTSAKAKKKHP